MITKHDLDEAIMECNGKKNPDANTCIKLAAFYTIKQHLFPDKKDDPIQMPKFEEGYSYEGGNTGITYSGDSDFAQAIIGRDQNEIMAVIDELMETLKVLNPRLYASVMRRIQ